LEKDIGTFKTPSLRNIALTLPYMHDGSVNSLSELLQHYNHGGKGFINKGATCYLNSLLQCILSCSSIYEVLKNKKNEPHIAKNKFAMELLNLFELSQDDSA
jgi:ubiquitin C-terminal hydrolase